MYLFEVGGSLDVDPEPDEGAPPQADGEGLHELLDPPDIPLPAPHGDPPDGAGTEADGGGELGGGELVDAGGDPDDPPQAIPVNVHICAVENPEGVK